MNFYQFYNQQYKLEAKGYSPEDFFALYNAESPALVSVTWFTIVAKLALESNYRLCPHYNQSYRWLSEVIAMLSAYLRSGYITGADYVEIYDQFMHLMRLAYNGDKQWRIHAPRPLK